MTLLISARASGLNALFFPAEKGQRWLKRTDILPSQPLREANVDPSLDLLPTDLAERLQVRTGGKRAVLQVPLTFLVPVLPLQLQLC